MEHVSSYTVRIHQADEALRNTLALYRQAVSFLVAVVQAEWHHVKLLQAKKRNNYIEACVHTTKYHEATYDFDVRFVKFPSYLRRSAIQEAIGIVSSYESRLEQYEAERFSAISNGKRFSKKPPKLQSKHRACPALYEGNMFQVFDDAKVQIKVYRDRDWKWLTVDLCKQDVKYLQMVEGKRFSPILEQRGRKFALRFAFKKNIKFHDKPIQDQRIVAVDLGMTVSAVCSVMASDGTVQQRLFVRHKREKDHQMRLLNRIKKHKRNHRTRFKKIWSKINNLNQQIVNDTVSNIVKFAKEHGANVIVMEHLSFQGNRPRSIRERFQLWAKRAIYDKVMHKAHGEGIRLRSVNARGTSQYAFDGSGILIRDDKKAVRCTFSNGKQYHSDLNASYNIGSRYYLNELQKTMPAKVWSAVEANVPLLTVRTQRTLAVYRSVLVVLGVAS